MAEPQPDQPARSVAEPTTTTATHDDHHAPTIARNARIGLWLFAVYVLLYGGFMALNAFNPRGMGRPALAGVNLAVTYGLALIVGAFVLALLYMFLVRARARDDDDDSSGGGGNGGGGGGGERAGNVAPGNSGGGEER